MWQIRLAFFCFVFSRAGLLAAVDSERITATSNWPGYPTSAIIDSYPAPRALYAIGGGNVYVFGPEQGNRGRPLVLDVHEVWPRRFFPLPNNRLLVGGLRGFAILDLADPQAPTSIQHVHEGGQVASVEGYRVYYKKHNTLELEVLDVSNPASPSSVARFEASYWDGTVAENLAYGVDRMKREFLVWAISETTNPVPRVLGRAPSEIGARRVYVHRRVAYVLPLDLEAGMEMFDIANPAEPRLIGRVNPRGAIYDMAFSGTTAWLSVADKGVMKLNLLNTPGFEPVSIAPLGAFPESIRIFDGRLYVADESAPDLRVFDSNSGDLVESMDTGETVEAVHVEGSSAVVVGRSGVRTFSIRGSATLLPLGTLRLEERIWVSARNGNHIYLNADPGLVVVDVADPSTPRIVFRGPATTTASGWTFWSTVYSEGGFLYIGTLEGLTIMDVSNPAQPAVLGQLPIGWMHSVFRAGNYLYLGRENAGFAVADISNPSTPVVVRDVPLSGAYFSFARDANLLIVGVNHISGSSSAEFVLFNLANPSNPSLVGYGPALQPIVSMEVENGRLFALTSARLRVFDLSEVPRVAADVPLGVPMPLLAHYYDFDRNYLAGTIEGNTLFTAEGNRGMSLWRVDSLIKLRAELRGSAVWIDWTSAGAGAQYEVMMAGDPSGPWGTVASTSSTNIELPIAVIERTGFIRVRLEP